MEQAEDEVVLVEPAYRVYKRRWFVLLVASPAQAWLADLARIGKHAR